jgi:hypothetical protein
MVGRIRTELACDDAVAQKRFLLYASLMRYGAETVPLRERAVDQLVLSALLGSSVDNAFKNGRIQETLSKGMNGIKLRPELIKESLGRLEFQGKVNHITERSKDVFFLLEPEVKRLGDVIKSSEDTLRPVLSRLLENTETLVSPEIAQMICKKFLALSFAKFGASIAQGVVGQPAQDLSRSELIEAYAEATRTVNLSVDASETLRARCISFFKSS